MNGSTSRLVKPARLYALLAVWALIAGNPGSAAADVTSPKDKDAQTRPASPNDVAPGLKPTPGASSTFTPKAPGTKAADTATGSGKEKNQK